MVFLPDIKDMERHRVEFRLSVQRAQKRFNMAQMLDDFHKILQDHLPNASEATDRQNHLEINRITTEEMEKLLSFIVWLTDKCQDTAQLELVQDFLRKGLIYARGVQYSNSGEVDPMCLFCMGIFQRVEDRHFRESTPLGRADIGVVDDDVHDEPAQQYEDDGLRSNRRQQQDAQNDQEVPMSATEHDHSYVATPVTPSQDPQFLRAQQVVEYQPFQIPPTPDEDANIDENHDNEPASGATPESNPAGSNEDEETTPNNAHEDSMHQWFFEGNRQVNNLPRVSSPLQDHIETQKQAAFDFEALAATLASHEKEKENGTNNDNNRDEDHAVAKWDQDLELAPELNVSPETTMIEQGDYVPEKPMPKSRAEARAAKKKNKPKKQSKKRNTKTTEQPTTAANTKAELIKMGVNPKIFDNHLSFTGPPAQSQQPISSIDLQVRESIQRARLSSSQAAAADLNISSSNSKQFLKHRPKGRRKSTLIET